MRSTTRALFALVAIAVLTAACQRDAAPAPEAASSNANAAVPAPAQPVAQTPAVPATAASMPAPPPPPLPEGTDVTYHCEDGNELTITYTYATADLHWPDGRNARLSRAATSGKAAGDAYSGRKFSLQHDGNAIQLREGNASAVACSESEATA